MSYVANDTSGYVKFSRKSFWTKFFTTFDVMFADITNVIGRKFRFGMLDAFCSISQTNFVGVIHIFTTCHPFKILNAIVGFVAVNVIDLRLAFGIWQKSSGNQNMDVMSYRVTVFIQSDT